MKEKTVLLVLHFCCMLATVAALDCSKQEELAQEIALCYKGQGIQLSLPDCANNRLIFPETWLMSTFIQHSSEICQKKEAYQNTINCIMDVITQCTTYLNGQALLRVGNILALSVAVVCDQELKIQYESVQKRVSQILEAEVQRLRERNWSKTKSWLGNW